MQYVGLYNSPESQHSVGNSNFAENTVETFGPYGTYTAGKGPTRPFKGEGGGVKQMGEGGTNANKHKQNTLGLVDQNTQTCPLV